ncbi:MAG: xanthine dehydrogenase family protein subunit M [Rhizobiales bacterium]|nr:xanthine dehydrogenase family protein subunit M [Hyphomicrobiales bacterium]
MKAAEFLYECPESLDAAIALLSDDSHDVMPIAGGQSLMPLMNFRMSAPDMLVDLNAIQELKGIRQDGEIIHIGAMTRYTDLLESPIIAATLPLLKMALPHIAHSAIRNRGTIGGSVSLADPAAEMPALLLALNAQIKAQGVDGERLIPADDFFLGIYETALEQGELVTEIQIPVATPSNRYAFYELARRHGDYAMSGVAISMTGTSTIESCRIAFFAVSDLAIRASAAEQIMTGKPLDDVQAIEQAMASLDEIEFMGDLNADEATKRHLSGVVLKRALAELAL